MKTHHSLPLLLLIFALSSPLLWSCQKQYNIDKHNTNKALTKQEIQQKIAVMQQFIELPVNLPVAVKRINEDGSELTPYQQKHLLLLGTGSGCYPAVEPEAIIESQAIMRNSCSSNDFQVYATFIISTENAIVQNNPNNTNQKTRGRVIISNTATGATLLTNNNIQPVEISAIGPDPSDPTRTKYRLSFTAQSVVFPASADGHTIRVGLYYYTECEEESQYPYTVVASIINLGSLPVCEVVHPVYFSGPISGSSGFIAGVANCAVCCFAPYPAQQEIQISANSNFTDLRHSEVPSNQPIIPAIISIGDYYQWEPLSGQRYIRFRNKDSNGCTGPWSSTKTVIIP